VTIRFSRDPTLQTEVNPVAVIAKNWTELKKPNRLEQRPGGGTTGTPPSGTFCSCFQRRDWAGDGDAWSLGDGGVSGVPNVPFPLDWQYPPRQPAPAPPVPGAGEDVLPIERQYEGVT